MKRLFDTKLKKTVALIVALILIVLGVRAFSLFNKEEETIEKPHKKVVVENVLNLSTGRSSLPLVGKVESQSQATLRAEAQGEIQRVNVKIGDSVYAGQVIAEIKNASQYAEVLRAQAVLDSAKANLSRVTGNSDENISLAKNDVQSAYSVASDAIRHKTDQFISDPDTLTPDVFVYIPEDTYEKNIEEKRVAIGDILETWQAQISNISGANDFSELEEYILYAEARLKQIQDYLNDVTLGLSKAEPSSSVPQTTLDQYRSDASTARSLVNAELSTLLASYNTLKSQVGENGTGQDILVAEANVKQAEAGLLSAQASLEKTIIRSSITGKVNSILIKPGDVVSNFQEAGQVIGSGELEIVTYVSEAERSNIDIGDEVLIEDKHVGHIIRIAPAVNAATQKIEVRISPDSNDTKLTNGSSVSIEVKRELEDQNAVLLISVPIQSVKITTDESYVLAVGEDNKLYSIPVELGELVGDKIIITSGLSLDDSIVVDARGLKVGQEVTTD